MLPKLQYISQGNTAKLQWLHIQKALDAGCTWIQLRAKNLSLNEIYLLAEKVKKLSLSYKNTLIINDHIDIALQVAADGVHLGLQDAAIASAKDLLPKGTIIGGTANTLMHVKQRITEGCDYIGLGPYQFTNTKQNLSPILGLAGYLKIIDQLNAQQKKTPLYAIGGIQLEDIPSLQKIGIFGIALSGTITKSENTPELIQNIQHFLYQNSNTL